ncbi:MAG: glutathione peroxidase [Bdellovibrionaceae bacterium]|nr:glutathione peroxidase [Pseudobdellovibrionaceae bacterium]
MSLFYDYTVKDEKNVDVSLSSFKGKTVLVVNVASKCGFTPQYTGLEEIYKKFKDKNFVIVGFPCNQFGFQEPGTNDEIQSFCKTSYDVTFPVMAKIDVNGNNASPLYRFLKEKAPGILGTEMIKWNFTKFLIDKNGNVIQRYAPKIEPKEIESDIARLLEQ